MLNIAFDAVRMQITGVGNACEVKRKESQRKDWPGVVKAHYVDASNGCSFQLPAQTHVQVRVNANFETQGLDSEVEFRCSAFSAPSA